MNADLVKKMADAARELIDLNKVKAIDIRGFRALYEAVFAFDVDAMVKPAHLHPKASEQTDDLQEVAK